MKKALYRNYWHLSRFIFVFAPLSYWTHLFVFKPSFTPNYIKIITSSPNYTYKTRRPLCTGRLFSAKNVTIQPEFEPATSCLPGRRTTNCAMLTRIYSLNGVIEWRFGRICKKNTTQITIFLPHNMWAENNITCIEMLCC